MGTIYLLYLYGLSPLSLSFSVGLPNMVSDGQSYSFHIFASTPLIKFLAPLIIWLAHERGLPYYCSALLDNISYICSFYGLPSSNSLSARI
ncbi:hypothetical protein EUGRSUZ_F02029 [Eucalyptus grandis]|uniref:Uncharacterized protein n=2 Tax=Eucalyptus grandis TaxID=71139 RepID=A0A059BQJ0_EUCGR|nr:hypothetical protein EUGRSUZ_F02029 [Eucalyptus grandis]